MSGLLLVKILIALAPAPILLAIFALLDVFRLMSVREILWLLLLGAFAGVLAFPVSGRLLDALPLGFSGYSRFVAPWIEEAIKGIAVLALFAANRIGFKLDAAVSGFAVGVGFAIVENGLYLAEFGTMGVGVWLVRGLGTAVMHGGTTALFATVAHELTERQARARASQWRLQPLAFLPGYAAAAALHTGFNQLPDRPLLAMVAALLAAPFSLLLIFRWGERESGAWLAADNAAHKARLRDLQADGFAATDGGRLDAALAARFGGTAGHGLIQEYVELHLELVMRAEQRLRHHAEGVADPITAVDRAALARFRTLKRELGKTVLAALAPSLPFSRNDLWELREFEEDADRGKAARSTGETELPGEE